MTADMGFDALESNRLDDLVLAVDWWPTGHLTFYAVKSYPADFEFSRVRSGVGYTS
jgi:hypothetical protein